MGGNDNSASNCASNNHNTNHGQYNDACEYDGDDVLDDALEDVDAYLVVQDDCNYGHKLDFWKQNEQPLDGY